MSFLNPFSNKNSGDISYKEKKTFEERKKEAEYILNKYNDRLPIICERVKNSPSVPALDKIKFLIPKDLTIGQFIHVVRKRINLSPTTAIFIYCNNIIPSSTSMMVTVYKECKDEDGFLYLNFNGEDTFGGA